MSARLAVLMVMLGACALGSVESRTGRWNGVREEADVTWLIRPGCARIRADAIRGSARPAELYPVSTGEEIPAWQRVGFNVLELAGGGAVSYGTAYLTAVEVMLSRPRDAGTGTVALSTCVFAANSALLTGSVVFGMDRLSGPSGSWGAAAGGAALGAAIGGPLFFLLGTSGRVPWPAVVAATIGPPVIGAVVSLDLWRSHPSGED
jgi:hypothetical protein